ncbi:MAG: isoprenylcysteine carboxylmethyltransferase family protein [Candidatus Omnitrophota bacterium]
MNISFNRFLPFYILFLLAGAAERVLSTFFGKVKLKPAAYVLYGWTFKAPFYVYLLIIFCSIMEFLLTVRTIDLAVSSAGIVSFVLGAVLRKKAMADLGDNWGLYTEIKKGHELVCGGVYKYLKHPYYLAVILELSGACLVANAYWSFMLVFLVQGVILAARIVLEEKMLTGYFGEKYVSYRRNKIF